MAHNNELEGKKVAILATDGFEEVELTDPLEDLKKAGTEVHLILEKKKIRSWQKREWGKDLEVDILLDDAEIRIRQGFIFRSSQPRKWLMIRMNIVTPTAR